VTTGEHSHALHTVDLDLNPNEASDLLPVEAPHVLRERGWDLAFWTVLDEGCVEDSIAVIGHTRFYVVGSHYGRKAGPLETKRAFVARFRESDLPGDLEGPRPEMQVRGTRGLNPRRRPPASARWAGAGPFGVRRGVHNDPTWGFFSLLWRPADASHSMSTVIGGWELLIWSRRSWVRVPSLTSQKAPVTGASALSGSNRRRCGGQLGPTILSDVHSGVGCARRVVRSSYLRGRDGSLGSERPRAGRPSQLPW
jgi:hypothetical protein